ncbi:hypothetical protein E2C01_023190 [Portunus trituberculatus]|uniref:Uncharacterized protein n=1 Tax=Portunus trituberculatus TaxID=210409 RepID=A0A5B7E9Q8_PORTR|nr:hypothetical protein [Portunus trituberculatus]
MSLGTDGRFHRGRESLIGWVLKTCVPSFHFPKPQSRDLYAMSSAGCLGHTRNPYDASYRIKGEGSGEGVVEASWDDLWSGEEVVVAAAAAETAVAAAAGREEHAGAGRRASERHCGSGGGTLTWLLPATTPLCPRRDVLDLIPCVPAVPS